MEIFIFLIFKFLMIKYCKNNMMSMIMFLMMFNLMFKINNLNWWLINYNFSMNKYSFGLIIMSFWIMSMIIMNLNKITDINIILLIIIMLMTISMNFMSMNMMLFYYFYELILIQIFILIMKWSSSKFKSTASYMIMFYTLLFTIPMLMIINFMKMKFSTLSFTMLENNYIYLNKFMMIFLLSSFLIKIPMFMIHNWLLKAHVEAPYYGSMILASILLKLGSYGLMRMFFIFYKYLYNNYLFMTINLSGMLILSIMCLRQTDIKLLIAISSIVHMSLMISSMWTNFLISFIGSYLMMLAHGLSSSMLFYITNTMYLESKSRIMMLNKGMIMFMPSMTLMWFMSCMTNMAAPISINLVSEIMLLMGLMMWLKLLMIFMMLYCLISFIYNIYLYSYIQHGPMDSFNYFFSNKNNLMYLTMILHLIPSNLITLNLFIII